MEEVEKQGVQKATKLKIRPNSSLEKLNSKLKFIGQITEFDISVLAFSQFVDIFTEVQKALFSSKELKKLNVSLQSLKNITFKDTLYKLADIKWLTDISLTFKGDLCFSKSQNETLSSCLCQFPLLSTLKIYLHSNCIDPNIIGLDEFYQRNSSLQNVEFQFQFSVERIEAVRSLMEGLKYSKNLESLSVRTLDSPLRINPILNIIREQLGGNSNLRILCLDFGVKGILTQCDLRILKSIIKSLQKLEVLNISNDVQVKDISLENNRFEESIQELTQLKELRLKLRRNFLSDLTELTSKIASISSLKLVELELKMNLSQVQNDIISFGSQLAKIQSLLKLKLSFDFSIQRVDVVMMVSLLKVNKNLKELELKFIIEEQALKSNPYENIEFTDFQEVLSNLERFSLIIYIDLSFRDDKLIQSIYKSLQNAHKLEEIKIEYRSTHSWRIKKKEISLDGLLQNTTNLKSINLFFPSFMIVEEFQFINLFQKLQMNPKLNELFFVFSNKFTFSQQMWIEISNSLVQLKELKTLQLTFSRVTEIEGSGVSYFTDSLSSLNQLETFHLEISKNTIPIHQLNNLMSSLHHLKKLKTLKMKIISDPFANGEEQQSFGDSFKLPQNLIKLDLKLEINNLSFRNMKNLFKNISTLDKVELLYLDIQLDFIDEEYKEVFDCFSPLKNLQRLLFSNVELKTLYLVTLFDQLPNLSEIKFYYNSFCASKSYQSKNKLNSTESSNDDEESSLAYTTQLYVNTNTFLQKEIKNNERIDEIVPFIFDKLQFLTGFSLGFLDKFSTGAYFSSVLYKNISLLENLISLKIYIMQNNQIGSQSLNELGSSLSKLKWLKNLEIYIQLKGNDFVIDDCLPFYSSLQKLQSLESLNFTLHFSENPEQDSVKEENNKTIVQLFENISQIPNLKTLQLTIPEFGVEEGILTSFEKLSSLLKSKLTSLELFLRIETIHDQRALKQYLLLFKKLKVLKINIPLELQSRLKRLVIYEQQSRSYYYY